MPGRRQDHKFVIIGLGYFGKRLARSLVERGYHVLAIDRDAKLVQRLSAQFPCVALDATDEAALREADIGDFATAVVAIGSDFECSVLATVALKSVGVGHIICQSATEYQSEILLQVGADRVIDLEADAGERLARDLMASHVQEQLLIGPGHAVGRLMIPEALDGQPLAHLGLSRHKIQVLAIQRGDVSLVQPSAAIILREGDLLIVLALNEAITRLSQSGHMFGSKDSRS